MSNKPERIYRYHVHFDPIFRPDSEIEVIREIDLELYAKSVDEAIATAWKTITVSPEEVMIDAVFETNYTTCIPRQYTKYRNE